MTFWSTVLAVVIGMTFYKVGWLIAALLIGIK